MIEQGMTEFLLNIHERHPLFLIARFFCCLSLALLSDAPVHNASELEKVKLMVANFLSTHTPREIAEIEERDQYSWRSLLPFYHLTSSKWVEFRQLGMFCLAHLAKRAPNRKLFITDSILPDALCFCWDTHEPTRLLAIEMAQQLYPISPPSLLQITRHRMRRDPELDEQAAAYEAKASLM